MLTLHQGVYVQYAAVVSQDFRIFSLYSLVSYTVQRTGNSYQWMDTKLVFCCIFSYMPLPYCFSVSFVLPRGLMTGFLKVGGSFFCHFIRGGGRPKAEKRRRKRIFFAPKEPKGKKIASFCLPTKLMLCGRLAPLGEG